MNNPDMNKPEWPRLDSQVKPGEGFLVDREIAQAIQKGQLISHGVDPASAKYACYEVHIGSDIRQLVMDQTPGKESDLYRQKIIPEDGVFRINPGETFKIYAAEELYMPANVFAITIPVGNMYKLGLNPETTFADPGFTGEFYVTVCNYSPRIVKLTVGDPLARVFFFKLFDRPNRIHDSKPREVPPSIERVRRPDLEELKKKGEAVVLENVLKLVDPPHYEHAFVTHQIFSHHRKDTNFQLEQLHRRNARSTLISLCSFLVVLLFAFIHLGIFLRGVMPEYFDNIAANILAPILVWVATIALISPIRRQFFDSITILRNKDSHPNEH